jgi:hypothetical protein
MRRAPLVPLPTVFLFGSHPCSGFLSEAQETIMSYVKKTLKTGTNTLETLEKMNGMAIVI